MVGAKVINETYGAALTYTITKSEDGIQWERNSGRLKQLKEGGAKRKEFRPERKTSTRGRSHKTRNRRGRNSGGGGIED